jgi:hypothetical protein
MSCRAIRLPQAPFYILPYPSCCIVQCSVSFNQYMRLATLQAATHSYPTSRYTSLQATITSGATRVQKGGSGNPAISAFDREGLKGCLVCQKSPLSRNQWLNTWRCSVLDALAIGGCKLSLMPQAYSG